MSINFWTIRHRVADAFSARNEWATLVVWLAVLSAATVVSICHSMGQIRMASVGVMVVLLASVNLHRASMAVLLPCLIASVWLSEGFAPHGGALTTTGLASLVVAYAVSWLQVRRRDRLGLRQLRAETVIEMISDRLEVQAAVPVLPAGWSVEVERRAAHGAAISGDFVVSRMAGTGTDLTLHLAIVDVSGSGIAAGPPALLLSGAVGGLLGAVHPDDFLPAANDYLTRQSWSPGFASASYITVVLATGEYQIRVAGHPPALHFRAGRSGTARWVRTGASGTLLGVLPALAGHSDSGVLEPGDVLIAYTDGLVEGRTRDLDSGIEQLQSEFDLLAADDSWTQAGGELLDRLESQHAEDRTVVLIRRQPVPAAARQRVRAGLAGDMSPASSAQAA
jgi:hypothetical protein